MKKVLIAALSLSLFSCGGDEEATNETDDTNNNELVENGEGFEIFEIEEIVTFEDYSMITTKPQLLAVFGEDNCQDDTAWFAEGMEMFMCTDVVNPNNGWRVRYVFEQMEPDTVNFIESNFHDWDKNFNDLGNQKVEASNGLYTGMPLAELIAWNEGDFDFAGFGWDYEGGITAPEGSKLEDSKVMISLTMDVGDGLDDKYQPLYGDMTMNSADARVQGAPIVVSYMSMYIKTFE